MGGHNAVAFGTATTNSSSQLMKLGKTEPVCILDHHQCGIGHIHTNLNDGGSNHHIRLASGEGGHGSFLFRALHLSVKQSDP